jgi:crotonobetainyl-CoA:carnitine CoA-transferase CaiB-like acyl-CoA transferase
MLIEGEGHRAPGIPVKLAQTPGGVVRRPPRFGEHAREILSEAGFDQAAIDGLIETGIVATNDKKSS